jgi:hypothetical protein
MSARRFRQGFGAIVISSAFVVACGWDPSRPFERESPQVREAIGILDGGDANVAGDLLEDYLATGACKEGSIGTPPRVRERSNGSFDLGLALFQLAERYGRRFGDEEVDAGQDDSALKTQRNEQIDCALKLVRAVGTDPAQPVDLRARVRYLEGNLLFMNKSYEEAVRAYDAALELAPGMHDSGPIAVSEAGRAYTPDLVGRDAAWNRAIALRRIEDKKDAGKDGGDDGGGDGGGDGGKKDDDKDKDGGANDKPDGGGNDGGNKPDAAKDAGDSEENKPKPDKQDEKPDAAPPPPPSRQNQDERMLDQLENAPTVQQETARKQGQKRRPARGMSDK